MAGSFKMAAHAILSPYVVHLYLYMYRCVWEHIPGNPQSVQLRNASTTTTALFPRGLSWIELFLCVAHLGSLLSGMYRSWAALWILCFRTSFFSRQLTTLKKFKFDEAKVSPCVCLCVCVHRKRLLEYYWSHHHQTWQGDCLRNGNASHVNYIDIDLQSRSHRSWSLKQ